MAEGAEEFVLGDRFHHGGAGSDFASQLVRALSELRAPLAVQPQITQGEMHLAKGGQAGIEGAAVLEFAVLLLRKRFARLPVASHTHQGAAIEAPVLHELAGEFDGIPLHVADPGRLRLFDGGEHVLEAMTELMEEGFHLLEAHQAGGVPHRRGLVADQVGNRQHEAAVVSTLTTEALIHPGTAALAGGSAVGIEVEAGDGFTTPQHIEIAHIVVPERCGSIARSDLHIEQPIAEAKQTIEHLGQREPGAQGFLVELETFAPQLLRPVRDIPGSQLISFRCTVATGAVLQILQLTFSGWIGRLAQFFEQRFHGRNILSHLVGETHLSPMAVPQAAGLLAPQRQDFFNQRSVVELPLTGSADMGAIDGFPQSAVFGVGEEGEVAGHVETQQPGTVIRCGRGISSLPSCSCKCFLGPCRQTSDLLGLGEFQRPLLGGIENVVAEAGGQGSQAFARFVEGGLGVSVEAHTALVHREQFSLENALLGGRQRLSRLIPQAAESLVQNLALPQSVPQTHHVRLLTGMGLTQFS